MEQRTRIRYAEGMKFAATENPRNRQGELGQFLTPTPVAEFMASMFEPLPSVVRLLDAGAGDGALTSAFVSRFFEKRHSVRAIEATPYELDSEMPERPLTKRFASEEGYYRLGFAS